MCLLVNQKKGYSFSNEWLRDFFKSNDDGIGVMYAEDDTIYVYKLLPKTPEDLIEFYRKNIDGKQCSFHLRMRTHGATDLDNCHPYKVFGEDEGYPLYLMHNGILHTGNKADVAKSDTWHYINDIIRPALMADKTQFMAPWFKALIEDHIGVNNKFVMMDAYGNTVTFNEDSGVDWNGNWMSNTYAWSADKAGLIRKKSYPKWDDDYYDRYSGYGYGGGSAGYNSSGVCGVPPVNSLATVTNINDLNGKSDEEYAETTVGQRDDDAPPLGVANEKWFDAMEFAALMRETFQYQAMTQAEAEIPLSAMANYYLNGPKMAWALMEDIENGYLDEKDAFDEFGIELPEGMADDHLKVGMH
jgi:hypothetical protein